MLPGIYWSVLDVSKDRRAFSSALGSQEPLGPEDEGAMVLPNVSNCLPNDTQQHHNSRAVTRVERIHTGTSHVLHIQPCRLCHWGSGQEIRGDCIQGARTVLGRHGVIRCTGTDVSDELLVQSYLLKNESIRSNEALVPVCQTTRYNI